MKYPPVAANVQCNVVDDKLLSALWFKGKF